MEHRQAKVNDDTDRRLEKLATDRDLEHESEAVRIAIEEGLRNLGYGTVDVTPDTRLRATLREVARILGYGGGMLLAAATLLPLVGTASLPVSVELAGVAIGAAGILGYGGERVLEATGATPVKNLTQSGPADAEVATDGGGGDSE